MHTKLKYCKKANVQTQIMFLTLIFILWFMIDQFVLILILIIKDCFCWMKIWYYVACGHGEKIKSALTF